LYGLKYLRIVDRSRRNQFSGAADGYDVDGVTVINGSQCSPSSTAQLARLDDGLSIVPDEASRAEVFPNPFQSMTQLQLTAGSSDESLAISVRSITGQVISTEQIQLMAGDQLIRIVDLSVFPAGIYLLEVQGAFGRETYKLVKN